PVRDETMSFISWLFNRADIQKLEYMGNEAYVVFEAVPWFAEKVISHVKELGGTIESFQH
ncbi:MAG: hypothetical protein QW827_05680, partial [Candidatus Bathyarchaeia archaeon]